MIVLGATTVVLAVVAEVCGLIEDGGGSVRLDGCAELDEVEETAGGSPVDQALIDQGSKDH